MQRFFVTFPLAIDMNIVDTNIVYQLRVVLRVDLWDHIVLFSGDGTEMEYEITTLEKRVIWLRWVASRVPNTEPRKSVTLYQALPNKYEKIEYIIQKWVEIGIARFVFFRSERSQKLLISSSKKDRFALIAQEALEQCGGVMMPEIIFQEHFPEASPESSISNIVLDTVWQVRHWNEFDPLDRLAIWIGPEWGWSEWERSKMINNGFIFARFGERVLRTETAGIVIGFGLLNW